MEYSEIHAVLIGRELGRNGLAAEGEALLHHAINSRQEGDDSDDWRLPWMYSVYGTLLREAGRLSEAEIQLQRALTLKQANTGSEDPGLLP